MSLPAGRDTLHASTVAIADRAVLIIGASGAGKSALALDLMSRGAKLVADDRTNLQAKSTGLMASAPERLKGLIEARGVGILSAQYGGPVRVGLVVDLDKAEPDRLPAPQRTTILGVELPLINGRDLPNLAAAVDIYLKGGRVA